MSRGLVAGCLGPTIGAMLSASALALTPLAFTAFLPPFVFAAVARTISQASVAIPFTIMQVVALAVATAFAEPEDTVVKALSLPVFVVALWAASIAGGLLGHALGSELARRRSEQKGLLASPAVERAVGLAEQELEKATDGWQRREVSRRFQDQGLRYRELEHAVLARHGYRLVRDARESMAVRVGRVILAFVGMALTFVLPWRLDLSSGSIVNVTYKRTDSAG